MLKSIRFANALGQVGTYAMSRGLTVRMQHDNVSIQGPNGELSVIIDDVTRRFGLRHITFETWDCKGSKVYTLRNLESVKRTIRRMSAQS